MELRKAHPSVISQQTPNKIVKKTRMHFESPLLQEVGKGDQNGGDAPKPRALEFEDPNFPISNLDT